MKTNSNKPRVYILKIGGQIINQAQQLADVLTAFAAWPVPKILVHGGGRAADTLLTQLGIAPLMRAGRRVTDAATLDAVVMTYAGLLNKQIVAQLQVNDCQAIGLCGADLNLIQAHQRPAQPIDFGFAGDVDRVNTDALRQLFENGITPVFCAITHDKNGQLLNTNADTVAAELAKALAVDFAVDLRYCLEKTGVLTDATDDTSALTTLTQRTYRAHQQTGVISGGMIPKLDNAFSVLEAGATAVWVGDAEGLAALEHPRGTRLVRTNARVRSVTQTPVQLLQQLIATPSFSRQETDTARLLYQYLEARQLGPQRQLNNVWAKNKHWSAAKPTILLNSHHDTVKPAAGYTCAPFQATIEGDKLYGLGSNDAGASLVALLAAFTHYYDNENLPYNLLFAATAEEEISGADGIARLLPHLPKIDFGIIGEPTQMRMAVAERGLMVIDAVATGVSGHAARREGKNAIDLALRDVAWINAYECADNSPLLGPSQMTVTQINAGTQHNVIPDRCTFVLDVRTNEQTTNEDFFTWLQTQTESTFTARSFRLGSSAIPLTHPAVQKGLAMGLSYYGSPTLSDQALIRDFPTLKMGVGKSKRSHTADEFVRLSELASGIATYIQFLDQLNILPMKRT
ncbi:MAG: acetylglutamate kinase [Bacteroidota bacterium]